MIGNKMDLCRRFIVLIVVFTIISGIVGVKVQITSRPKKGTCLCATKTALGRSKGSLSGKVVVELSKGRCGRFVGRRVKRDGYTWYQILYEEKTVWVAGNYLKASSSAANDCSNNIVITRLGTRSTRSVSDSGASCIVRRAEWGARPPREKLPLLAPNLAHAIVHHSATVSCNDQASCAAIVRFLQNYHMDYLGWHDIGFSFLIGGDGCVFEGSGWGVQSANNFGYNEVSPDFCLIGNFDVAYPTRDQLIETARLLSYGVSGGYLSGDYALKGHRDIDVRTTCPGKLLYDLLQTLRDTAN